MQKRYLGIVRPGSSMSIHHLIPLFIRVHPSLWPEHIRVLAPELWTAINSVRAEEDPRSFRDGGIGDSSVADGFTQSQRDGGIQAKDLLDDAVQ